MNRPFTAVSSNVSLSKLKAWICFLKGIILYSGQYLNLLFVYDIFILVSEFRSIAFAFQVDYDRCLLKSLFPISSEAINRQNIFSMSSEAKS